MKSAFKKLTAVNRTAFFRGLLFSVLFLAFYFFMLYFLINSPA